MRIELKYVVPIEILPSLHEAILPFVSLDSYCTGLNEDGYTVRSIYLDSPSLRYYHEKQNHLRNRKKIRVRGYNAFREDDVVFLEIKRKFDSAIEKERASVKYRELAAAFALEGDAVLPEVSNPLVGRRVLYHVHSEHLLPTSLVVYERLAFQGQFDRSFRITFDSNLRGALYPGIDGLYQEHGLKEALPGKAIVEIKYHTRLPAWIRPVIARFGLMQRSASKYCMCIDLFDQRPISKNAVLANASPAASNGKPVTPIAEAADDAR